MTGDQDVTGMAILGKAGAVLASLEERGELSAQELAAAAGEPLSSTYRLLASLTGIGWVDPGSRRSLFRLGVGVIGVGGALEDGINVLDACRPTLRHLRTELEATSFLCVRQGLTAVCVDRLAARNVQSLAMTLGGSLPLHSGAAPLAILSFLPPEERAAVLDSLDAVATPGTPSRATVEARIETTRSQGYAVSDQDVTTGIAAIGGPVFNHRGEVVAAISTSGLREHVLSDIGRAADLVRAGTRECSREMGFGGTL